MTSRSECVCPCHRNPDIRHCLPCCSDDAIDPALLALAEEVIASQPEVLPEGWAKKLAESVVQSACAEDALTSGTGGLNEDDSDS